MNKQRWKRGVIKLGPVTEPALWLGDRIVIPLTGHNYTAFHARTMLSARYSFDTQGEARRYAELLDEAVPGLFDATTTIETETVLGAYEAKHGSGSIRKLTRELATKVIGDWTEAVRAKNEGLRRKKGASHASEA
jgi:hypothetical protein